MRKTPLSGFSGSILSYPSVPKTLGQEGWKSIPITGSNEKLVPLGAFAGDPHEEYKPYSKIFTDAMYFAQHDTSPYKDKELNGALLTCFVRESVAEALVKAQKLLPEGYAFVVWDAYRPQSVQQALFEDYRDELIAKDGQSLEQATKDAQEYVSIPSKDPRCPPPHNTGASIDLGLIKFTPSNWQRLQELNAYIESESDPDKYYAAEMQRLAIYRRATAVEMGTRFDEMSVKANTSYYEDKLVNGSLMAEENEILMNRRMLVDVMHRVGMSNYGPEWFHFDLNNQFDAKRMGKDYAVYGGAVMSEKNWAHENMRRQHRVGSEIHRTMSCSVSKSGLVVSEHPLVGLVRKTARQTGPLAEAPRLLRGDRLEFHSTP